MRRVVITGVGMVSPLGCGVEVSWSRLLAGDNAAERISSFEVDDLSCQIACQIPRGDGTDGTYNPDDWLEPKEQRKVDDFIVFAIAAAEQAMADAAWRPEAYEDQIRTGVLIGSGIGGLQGIEKNLVAPGRKRPTACQPVFYPRSLD